MRTTNSLKQWALDPVLLIGVAASVAVSVLLYQQSNDAKFGFLVGLGMTVVTIEIQIALGEKDRLNCEMLYGKITAAIERGSWLSSDVRDLLGYMEGAEGRFRNSPVAVTCKTVISRLVADMAQLSEGRIRLVYLDKEFAVNVTGEVRHSIRAMTVETAAPGFWLTPIGRQYLRLQAEAVRRGVVIERIFVYQEWSPELDTIAREQAEAGIRVYKADGRRLRPDLRTNLAVWDDVCGFETEVNASGDVIAHRLTIVDYEVQELTRRFQNVWAVRECIDPHTESIDSQAAGAS
ncbi:MAG TPA: hypothetical protein VFM55_07150 [Micromonosporaceae bacterium]|nr:hypothetical protein [Micromonosporaceae bacterium]